MGNDSELSIIVRARNEASRVLDQVKKDADDVGGKVGNAFKNAVPGSTALLAGVTAAAAGVVAFGGSSVKAYMEAEQASAQLEAVLKSTGGAAGVTSEELMKQATALQGVTKFSDEAVMATQSMLLTFTNIKGGVMKDATKTALDMAQALGMDGKQAAMQLGKALNDPAEGLSKLQRVGVTFNAQQEEQIKKMAAAGDVAGAQKLMLQELQKEFGGSAEAAGGTFAGKLEILKNTFGDLQETVGKVIVDALMPLATAFSNTVTKMQEAGGFLPYIQGLFEQHKGTIAAVAGAIMIALLPALGAAAVAFWGLLSPLLPFLAIGAAIGIALNYLADRLGGWGPIIDVAKGAFEGLMTVVGGAVDVLSSVAKWFADNEIAMAALAGGIIAALIPAMITGTISLYGFVAGLVATRIAALMAYLPFLPLIAIGAALGAIAYLIIANWDTLKQWFNVAVTTIGGWISALASNIVQWFHNAVNFVVAVWQGFVAIVGAIFGFIAAVIRGYINTYIAIIQGIIGAVQWIFSAAVNVVRAVWGGIVGFFSGIVGGIAGALGGVINAIKSPFESAFNWLKGLPGKIVDLFTGVGGMIRNAIGNIDIPGPLGRIKDVIPGFASGVRNFAGGMAVVGERGPELVNLPRGSDVYSNRESRGMLAGAGGGMQYNQYGDQHFHTAEAVDRWYDRMNKDAENAALGVPI